MKNPKLGRKSKEFKNVMQFFENRNEQNDRLGIQLLQSTMNPKTIIQVLLSPIYPSDRICYPMVPFFQQHPQLWKEVKEHLPSHIANEIKRWLPFTLLDFDGNSIEAFCAFATQKARDFFADFPELTKAILTKQEGNPYFSFREGSNIENAIGWSLKIEGSCYGPAEIFNIDEWEATAHHPVLSIKISRLKDSGKITKSWMHVFKPHSVKPMKD